MNDGCTTRAAAPSIDNDVPGAAEINGSQIPRRRFVLVDVHGRRGADCRIAWLKYIRRVLSVAGNFSLGHK